MGLFKKISKAQYVGEVTHIMERLNDMFDSPIIDKWLVNDLGRRISRLKNEWGENYDVPKDFLYNSDAMVKMFSGDMQGALQQSKNSLDESGDRANYLAHKIRGYVFLHQDNKKPALDEFRMAIKDLKELNKISKTLEDKGFYEGTDEEDYELNQLEALIKENQ